MTQVLLDPLGHVARWRVLLVSGHEFLLCQRCQQWFVSRSLVVIAESLAPPGETPIHVLSFAADDDGA